MLCLRILWGSWDGDRRGFKLIYRFVLLCCFEGAGGEDNIDRWKESLSKDSFSF